MLLHAYPHIIRDQKIILDPHVRSPLALSSNHVIWIAFHTKNSLYYPELILSPYDYILWDDLWRFEIHLSDAKGQLNRLIEIFDKRGIKLLSYESRSAYHGEWHVKYMMINCEGYNSSIIDGRHAERIEQQEAQLQELEYDIYIAFSREIRISESGWPKLSITRNRPYHEASIERRTSDNAFAFRYNIKKPINQLTRPIAASCNKDGLINIPDDIWKIIKKVYKTGDLIASATTNVRSRIGYITIEQRKSHDMVHIIIDYDRANNILAQVTSILASMEYTITRSQLREGPRLTTESAEGRSVRSPRWSEPATLNIAARAMDGRHILGARRVQEIRKRFRDELGKSARVEEIRFGDTYRSAHERRSTVGPDGECSS